MQRRGVVAGNSDLHHALGLLLVRQKRMQESIEQLRRAAELAPDRSRYAYVYALALQGMGEAERAARVLEQALEQAPANREIRVALLGMYRETGDLDAVRRHAGILQRQNPGDREIQALWESVQTE